MRRAIVVMMASGLLLAGCGKVEQIDAASRGRYAGVGLYAPGDNWRELADSKQPKDEKLAHLRDDDTIIVTVDSQTGELRQCGNMSGVCTTMSPWAAGNVPPVRLPARLSSHHDAFPAAEAATSAG